MTFLKGLFKWAFISLGALALLGIIVGKEKSPPTSGITTSTVSSTRATSKAEPLRMSISAIEDAVEENEINIQNRIKAAGGVLVQARVKSVESIWGSPVIHFRGKNEFLDASAFLAGGDKDRAATLKKGETVTIICQTAKKVMGAALYDCRFN